MRRFLYFLPLFALILSSAPVFAQEQDRQTKADLLGPGMVNGAVSDAVGHRSTIGDDRPTRTDRRPSELRRDDAPVPLSAPDDALWSDRFSGSSSVDLAVIYAVATDGESIYVGGSFSMAGGVPARNIARWKDGVWSALGAGINAPVYAIAIADNGDVYAGGSFDTAGATVAYNIARWSGDQWNARLDGPVNGIGSPGFDAVYTIATAGTDVYVGGFFDRAGTSDVGNIVRWNTTSGGWSTLGADPDFNGVLGDVYSIVVAGTDVYVGGSFTEAGEIAASNVARWNSGTNEWAALGDGVDGNVLTMAFSSNKLYVGGGAITSAGSVDVAKIAVWNVSNGSWGALGSGVADGIDGRVTTMIADGGDLYVGGDFEHAGSLAASNIVKWNGSKWSALGAGIAGGVEALARSGTNIYAVGQFVTAGDVDARYVSRWDGSSWGALGDGVSLGTGASVLAVTVNQTQVYVGGTFLTAGGKRASNIAMWDRKTNTWSALGDGTNNGVNGPVTALATMENGDIYVAGLFTRAGDVPVTNVARWSSATGTWLAVGDGIDGLVRSVEVDGGNVYVGGTFFKIVGGDTARAVVRWNPTASAWETVGGNLQHLFENFSAIDLGFDGGSIIAAGSYAVVGGTRYGVARWNGTEWTSILDSASGEIGALAVGGGSAYLAVTSYPNDEAITTLERWNSSSGTWSTIGSTADSLDGTVKTLDLTPDGGLIAGGQFLGRDAAEVRNIARWNLGASGWHGLGSGANGEVNVVLHDQTTLYVGGIFTAAGDKEARFFSVYNETPLSVERRDDGSRLVLGCRPNPVFGSATISVDLPRSGDVVVELFDVRGDRIRTLAAGPMEAGHHEIVWSADGLPVGTYLCRVSADGGSRVLPMTVSE